MLEAIKQFLTTETAQWYETLPFYIGGLFFLIELIALIVKKAPLKIYPPKLGYIFSEGVTVCVMPIYGVALAFDRVFAAVIADKNSKILVVAMVVAFLTLFLHIIDEWRSSFSN